MSAILSIGDEPAIDHQRPIFYFDFTQVLARSQALKRNPERVKLMCENCVRRLAPGDLMLAQTDGFFLVVHSAQGSAAEALAHEINVALLELFFGTDALSKNLGTICRRATLEEIGAQGLVLPPERQAPPSPSGLEHIEADPLARLALAGLPGYEGMRTGLVPLINLQRNTTSLFLCGPVRKHEEDELFGAEALAHIDARDRASLDEAMLEYGLTYARSMAPTPAASAVITSVNFETLAWSRGRQLYQKALRNADAANNPFLLVKIEGVPSGTPAARLAEIVAMVRPFVHRVFLELPAWDQSLLSAGHLGVSGITTPLPAGADLASAGRILSGLVHLAASQQAVASVTNLRGPNQLALARAAGVRFAAGHFGSGFAIAA